jgi:hypothetical protein
MEGFCLKLGLQLPGSELSNGDCVVCYDFVYNAAGSIENSKGLVGGGSAAHGWFGRFAW